LKGIEGAFKVEGDEIAVEADGAFDGFDGP